MNLGYKKQPWWQAIKAESNKANLLIDQLMENSTVYKEYILF